MKTKFKILIIFIALFILSVPFFCWADETQLQGTAGSGKLPNPLGNITDPRELIGIVINGVLGLVGSIALLVFIAGGIIWMTSGGSAEKVQKGKNMIIWAALGLAVIFFSYAIIRFVLEALTKAPS